MTTETWLPLVLGYLIPVGFFLLGWGGMEPEHARRAAARGLLALALATLGYFAVGFAFHLGGAGLMSNQEGLAQLDLLVRWGFIGLDGFFLSGGADTPEALLLFAAYLPLAATAVLIPVISLSRRATGWQTALLGLLVAAVLFPLPACWTWGGGWLAALGQTVERGHGLVDYAGSGAVYLLGGMIALGGALALPRTTARGEPVGMPPAHFPLLACLGALLTIIGWLGWSLGTPFHAVGAAVNPGRVAAGGLLGTAGATLTCLIYCWLVLGHSDPLMVARGAVAGLVAVSAGAPFLPPWASLVVGGLAGLLLPFGIYLVDHLLRLADSSGAVATTALSGMWGLLAVALFADGRSGQGWNGVGLETYRTVTGQGVTGFLAAHGMNGDGPGQLIAQLAGLVAIALAGLLSGWLTITLLELPRHPRPAPQPRRDESCASDENEYTSSSSHP